MRKNSSFATLIFIVIFGIGVALTYAMYSASANVQTVWIGVIAFFVALFVSLAIPSALEDAMSMQAQAERERQARVILGDSERQVAEKFGEAARTYANDPIALHLRAMNMLYEGLKENATIVIVPSTAVESMQLGGLAGMTALTMGIGQERANREKEGAPGKQE
jgi:hypothetical protein